MGNCILNHLLIQSRLVLYHVYTFVCILFPFIFAFCFSFFLPFTVFFFPFVSILHFLSLSFSTICALRQAIIPHLYLNVGESFSLKTLYMYTIVCKGYMYYVYMSCHVLLPSPPADTNLTLQGPNCGGQQEQLHITVRGN